MKINLSLGGRWKNWIRLKNSLADIANQKEVNSKTQRKKLNEEINDQTEENPEKTPRNLKLTLNEWTWNYWLDQLAK